MCMPQGKEVNIQSSYIHGLSLFQTYESLSLPFVSPFHTHKFYSEWCLCRYYLYLSIQLKFGNVFEGGKKLQKPKIILNGSQAP